MLEPYLEEGVVERPFRAAGGTVREQLTPLVPPEVRILERHTGQLVQ